MVSAALSRALGPLSQKLARRHRLSDLITSSSFNIPNFDDRVSAILKLIEAFTV
jgi:hypothetical protein